MFLDKKTNLVIHCPDCQAKFIQGKGAACPATCLGKKLEIKHRQVLAEILNYCLPKQTFQWECPQHLSAQTLLSNGWGWTNDIKKVIVIPWYTLRSKAEFFDTVIHELGHLKAYQKKFALSARNILKKFFSLQGKENQALLNYDFPHYLKFNQERWDYYQKNQKLIDKYSAWEGHDYNPWYQEYLKLHQWLVNSPYVQYAYGNTKVRQHGFDKQGKGRYIPKIKLAGW